MKKVKLISIIAAAILLMSMVFMFTGCNGGEDEVKIVPKPVDGIPPIFDEGMDFYNIQPSVIQTSDSEMFVYYTVNKSAKGSDDVIAVRKATKADGKWSYGEKKTVLQPSAGKWDSRRVLNADVIKGKFSYNNEEYSYLMAYQANNIDGDKNYNIGFAVAKAPDSEFVKVEGAVIKYDSEVEGDSWGVGQPSLVSYDENGKVYLFYTMGDPRATACYVKELDCTNLADIKGNKSPSALSTIGLKENNSYIMFNDADFALDKASNTLYVVRNFNPESGTAPRLTAAVQVAKTDIRNLYKPDSSWQIIEEKVNMLDLEDGEKSGWERVYSGCIVSDAFGRMNDLAKVNLALTVTSYDLDTKEFRYYQTITMYATDNAVEG